MGLLSRLPGFRQLAQLKQLKGMEPEELASLFGLPKEMTQAMPPVGGRGSHSAAVARQRLMGFNQNPPRQLSDDERKKLREKRKQERRNKKKNRRR
jgi:signal recognition particle subunit SRP54